MYILKSLVLPLAILLLFTACGKLSSSTEGSLSIVEPVESIPEVGEETRQGSNEKPIVNLSVSHTQARIGDYISITYLVEGASSCSSAFWDGPVAKNGEFLGDDSGVINGVSEDAVVNRVYTLECWNSFGLTSKFVEVIWRESDEPINLPPDQEVELTTDQMVDFMKHKSCMFDGLIYPPVEDELSYHQLLERSNCEILPRSIETWNSPPDMNYALANMVEIKQRTGRDFVYGMFIAEAIEIGDTYTGLDGESILIAQDMCLTNTLGQWGTNTCIPDFRNASYKNYVFAIVKDAIQIGVRDFLLGQVDLADPYHIGAFDLTRGMRNIAREAGVEIIIGAQPGWYSASSYLQLFDYIVGPARLSPDGQFYEGQDCKNLSQLPDSFCDNLKYSSRFRDSAKAVVIELDWYSTDDDAHRFTRLSQQQREQTLIDGKLKFNTLDVGFIMPFRMPLNGGNINIPGFANGCFGYNQWVFSASNNYSCSVEDTINQILDGSLPH